MARQLTAPGPAPQAVTRKTRILDVSYNASNNELVRTQTLVKNAIIQVDATPFKQWYQVHYGQEVGQKKKAAAAAAAAAAEGGESGRQTPGGWDAGVVGAVCCVALWMVKALRMS
jgi:ribosomal protein S8E